MERFARRKNILMGHSPQGSFDDLPKSANGNLDMDFSDVFGGPPKRISIQEVRTRYSFNETMEFGEEAVSLRSPWCGFYEKPVFGAESGNRRQYPDDDFFDDIFRGDETKSYNSPPRNSRDAFGSNPGSQFSSPAWPLPPQAEPFSTSLPDQFSLPAKLTKAMEFPVFASANHSLHKSKDGMSNGISYSHTSNISLSRFSSQASELLEESRNSNSFHCQTSLSHEVSIGSEESAVETKSDVKDKEHQSKNDSESMEAPTSSNQFHFSIYKWAGKGVPLLMPLLVGNRLRSKARSKLERCSSTNGRFDSFDTKIWMMEEHIESLNNKAVPTKVKDEKPQGNIKETKMESDNTIMETHPDTPASKHPEPAGSAIPFGSAIFSKKPVEESNSNHQVDLCQKTEDEVYINKDQATKPELKPLHSFLGDKKKGQDDHTEGEESTVKVENVANKSANVGNSEKQASAKRTNSNHADLTNDSPKSSETSLGDAPVKSRAQGKVREFVKIFNQETSAKSKANFDIPTRSYGWKGTEINGKENENNNASKKEEKVHMHNKKRMPNVSVKEDIKFNVEKFKQDPRPKSLADKTSSQVTKEKNASLFSDSFLDYSEVEVENGDESFQGHFMVEELSHAQDKDLQTGGDSEDIKALDAKIQQWSSGRKGNIRSLLSTLQHVLWSGSGWKPVPLVDLIEGNAVKRAYQKALLCLHPDKLQQKGARTDHKYIAEKTFDILQEAWDHFNSLGAI